MMYLSSFLKIWEARQKSLKDEGFCPYCGRVRLDKVSKKLLKNKRTPIESILVYKGTCVICALMRPLLLGLGFSIIWKYLFPQIPWWERLVETVLDHWSDTLRILKRG
mmetsp:Transcript_2534/g.3612  ORF Transcript_2534/g.3612 Transcript_2534/m.3612 type:complete len:108 (+) Transcript_2534:194-517(+)